MNRICHPSKIRHKMCAFISTGLLVSRVVDATLVRPSLKGALVSWYGLVAVGVSAAALSSLGLAKSFLRVPSKDTPCSSRTFALQFTKTLTRCLLFPGFAEEAVWRCLIHPSPITSAIGAAPAATFSWATIQKILMINAAFSPYHPIVGKIVWELIPLRLGLSSLHRPGVTHIFTEPAFLFLTFVLGNVCSAACMLTGGDLYAPVFIHAVAVAVWLEVLGGAKALRIEKLK